MLENKTKRNPELISTFIELIKFLDEHNNEPVEFLILEGELQLTEPTDSYSEKFLNMVRMHSFRLQCDFHELLDYYASQMKLKGFTITQEDTRDGALIKIYKNIEKTDKNELKDGFFEILSLLKNNNEPVKFIMLNGEMELVEPTDELSESFLSLIKNKSKALNTPFYKLIDYYCDKLKDANFIINLEETSDGDLITINK